MLNNAGVEMIMRPVIDSSNRLMVYADLASRIGADTDYVLQDGAKREHKK